MTAETKSLSLKELYIDHLKDLHHAENLFCTALPNIIQKVTSLQLEKSLETHLGETEKQIIRLDQVFDILKQSSSGGNCVGMRGLLEEGSKQMNKKMESPALLDAALIGVCQNLEHYEISAYSTVIAFAELLGESEIASILKKNLEEEKAAEEKLTELRWTQVSQLPANSLEKPGLEEDSLKEQLAANDSLGG